MPHLRRHRIARLSASSACSTASTSSTASDRSSIPTSASSRKKPIGRHPDLPANYPFETPFHVGFFGALFAPEKSIFLFDPLLILTHPARRRRLETLHPVRPRLRHHQLPCCSSPTSVSTPGTPSGAGDFAWGDRYVSTAVELAALLAVPLLLRYRRELGKLVLDRRHCRFSESAPRSRPRRSPSGCRSRSTRWTPSAIPPSSSLSALQKHRRLCAGQDGRMGPEHCMP